MERFAQAVQILNQGDASAALTQQAHQYLHEVKESGSAWVECVQRFAARKAGDEAVRFQCLVITEHAIKTRYPSFGRDQTDLLKATLSSWLTTGLADPPFLKNKAAQICVLIFANEFPDTWPTFFIDLMAMLSMGPAMMDFFFRVLNHIDEIVVDREIIRTTSEADRNTRLKDAMRVRAMPAIAQCWAKCLQTCATSHPGLCCICIQVMAKFVSWVDISLIVNPAMTGLLLSFIPENVAIRADAVDCLTAVVAKGMGAAEKCRLIGMLGLVGKIGEWLVFVQTHGGDDECDFAVAVARLYCKVAVELLDAADEMKSAKQDPSSALAQLEASLPLMCALLGHEDDDVSEGVLECVQQYIQYLQRGGSGSISSKGKQGVTTLIGVMIRKMRYDESYDHEDEGELEGEFQQYRKSLKVALTLVAKVDETMVLQAAMACVRANLEPSALAGRAYPDVELALYVTYQLAHIFPQANFPKRVRPGVDPNASPLVPFMMAVVESNVINTYRHPAVSHQFFEICVGLNGFFKLRPRHIEHAIAAFLGPPGLMNANVTVRKHAVYKFMGFVKACKDLLHPLLPTIVERLRPCMLLGAGKILDDNEQQNVFEAVSIMLFAKGVSPSNQRQLFQQVTEALLGEHTKTLAAIKESHQDREKCIRLALVLHHIPCAMTALSKGIKDPTMLLACGCTPFLEASLRMFVQSLTVPYEQKQIRIGVRSFLHRLITCMGKGVVPAIPTIFNALAMSGTDYDDTGDTVSIACHIVTTFGAEFAPQLNELLSPLVRSIFAVLNAKLDVSDREAVDGHARVHRKFIDLLNTIIDKELSGTLVSPKNLPMAQEVLKTLVQTLGSQARPETKKVSIVALRKLSNAWFGKGVVAGFESFVFSHVVRGCFQALLSPSFDAGDAAHNFLLIEAAALIKTVHSLAGAGFEKFLQSQYLPSIGLAVDVTAAGIAALQKSPPPGSGPLVVFLTQLVAWGKQQQSPKR